MLSPLSVCRESSTLGVESLGVWRLAGRREGRGVFSEVGEYAGQREHRVPRAVDTAGLYSEVLSKCLCMKEGLM